MRHRLGHVERRLAEGDDDRPPVGVQIDAFAHEVEHAVTARHVLGDQAIEREPGQRAEKELVEDVLYGRFDEIPAAKAAAWICG